MKKLKLNIQHLDNAGVLSREQLKKVVGGFAMDGSGDCQEKGSDCDTQSAKNCCNGLVCGSWKCRTATA